MKVVFLNKHRLCLLLSWFLVGAVQGADLMTLGMSEYKRLNRSEFIAELSVPETLKDTGDSLAGRLMSSNVPAQMKMIITAQRLSARNFVNRWIEGVSVNNQAPILAREKSAIQAFARAFKGRLLRGDRVIIERRNNDLWVSVNGVSVLNVPSKKGFSLLLSTWIGDVPLSSGFRNGVLGKLSFDELAARAEHLPILPHRKTSIRTWLAESDAESDSVVSNNRADELAGKKDSPKGNSETKPTILLAAPEHKPSPNESSKLRPTLSPSYSGNTSAGIEREVLSVPKLLLDANLNEKESTNVAKRSNTTPLPPPEPFRNHTQRERAKPKGPESGLLAKNSGSSSRFSNQNFKSVNPNSRKNRATPEEQGILFTSDNLFDYQQYYSRLSKSVNIHRNLPRSALVKKISGEVRISVKLDRSGKILSQSLTTPSRYKVLNKQAMEAVALASPFAPVPSSITGENLVFDLLVVYPKYW